MAYLALLLYTALIFIRPQEWAPLVLEWPLIAIAIGFAILAWCMTIPTRDWRFGKISQDWLMLGFVFAVLMSHVSHFYFEGTSSAFKEFGKVALLYVMVSSLVDTQKKFRGFLLVLLGGCLFLSVHIMLQTWQGTGFGGLPPRPQVETSVLTIYRPVFTGIFDDPNDLALMLVAILPFSMGIVLNRARLAPARLLALLVSGVIVIAVYLTNSRGGWLALGVMGLTFLYTHFSKKVGIAIAVIGVTALVGFGPSRMGLMSNDEESARARLMAWGDGNQMLKANPIFGVGKGLFVDHSEFGLVAHNSFVQCYAELGLFGYFFWLALLLASLKDAYALSKLESEDPEVHEYTMFGKAALASLVGFMSAAFFLSRTYIIPLFMLIALVAAVRRQALNSNLPQEIRFFRQKDYKYALAAEILSIPAMYVVIRMMH